MHQTQTNPHHPIRLRVLLPLPLSCALDYVWNHDSASEFNIPPQPGSFVTVPLGQKKRIGVIWDERIPSEIETSPIAFDRLRPIFAVLPTPHLPLSLRQLIDWMAQYTLTPPGLVLRMAMSVPKAFQPISPKTNWTYRLVTPLPVMLRLTATRQKIIAAAQAQPTPCSASTLAKTAGVSVTLVQNLAKAGALERIPVQNAPPLRPNFNPSLSPEQQKAADKLIAHMFALKKADQKITKNQPHVILLDGVTGSGKTEVYFAAIAQALHQGQQALVLLPEIALSAQWLTRFTTRFGSPPAVWHSEIGQANRRHIWQQVAAGSVPVLVGARSALFLPFPDLGLIIVDEEHDQGYKQEDQVIYQARDMAVVRARLAHCACILASATPSLETRTNVAQGRYNRVSLTQRHAGATLPEITLLDLRHHHPPPGHWLSPPLVSAIAQTLADRGQAMLFLNRRGYAPLTLCKICGHRLHCPNCTAWLVIHQRIRRSICHHCGFSLPPPTQCPQCQTPESMIHCGPGIERIAEEATKLFEQAKLMVMASDILTHPGAGSSMIDKITNKDCNLIIGTQILAKGHHFPDLTLVGVVDGDLGLDGGDLRAAERTYQLLTQVGGRAGRAERPGHVFLQTHQPDHPVMQALAKGNHEQFYHVEAEMRRAYGFPPFGRLAALIISDRTAERADQLAYALARAAPTPQNHGPEAVRILGPAPAPLALLQGRHRRRFLIISPHHIRIQPILRHWIASIAIPNGAQVRVDIDPYSFL